MHAYRIGDIPDAVEMDDYDYDICPDCGNLKLPESQRCNACAARATAVAREQAIQAEKSEAMLERHRRLRAARKMGFDIETLMAMAYCNMPPTWEELGGEALCREVWRQMHP
jgi:hypothetical protein